MSRQRQRSYLEKQESCCCGCFCSFQKSLFLYCCDWLLLKLEGIKTFRLQSRISSVSFSEERIEKSCERIDHSFSLRPMVNLYQAFGWRQCNQSPQQKLKRCIEFDGAAAVQSVIIAVNHFQRAKKKENDGKSLAVKIENKFDCCLCVYSIFFYQKRVHIF